MVAKQKNNLLGFLAVLVLVAAVGAGGWWYSKSGKNSSDETASVVLTPPVSSEKTQEEDSAHEAPAAGESVTPEAAVASAAQSLPETAEEKVTIDLEKAMAPRTLGSADAPVKIIEYASLTCSHCAHFHNDVLPTLKSKYIDTGKVFIEFREFPLNDPALKATMAARCLPADKYDAFVGLLFKTQEHWAGGLDYMAALRQNAKLAGMSDATFDACQNSRELMLKIADGMQIAKDKWKIEATPTFILNDGKEKISGAQPLAEFERAFRKLTNDAVGAAPAVQ